MNKPLVSIIMGSDSDLPIMKKAAEFLDTLEIPYEVKILSAHRTPDEHSEFSKTAESRGIKVIIAGAGGAAHLAGVTAANTILPVIGVPISSKLDGMDSLLSIVQMPSGVPVATVAIDGAKNAGILAAEILAISDERISTKLKNFKKQIAEDSIKKNKNINF
jgi:5-(carboxyamino)imidazole ribonucleotide mutase